MSQYTICGTCGIELPDADPCAESRDGCGDPTADRVLVEEGSRITLGRDYAHVYSGAGCSQRGSTASQRAEQRWVREIYAARPRLSRSEQLEREARSREPIYTAAEMVEIERANARREFLEEVQANRRFWAEKWASDGRRGL